MFFKPFTDLEFFYMLWKGVPEFGSGVAKSSLAIKNHIDYWFF